MKNLFCCILLTIIVQTSYLNAQSVNGIPIKDINVPFIQIVGRSNITGTRVTVEIDFGQESEYFSTDDTRIVDENGKNLKFNSMIDALNFFSKNGYDYRDAYTLTRGSTDVYHFLLKKRE
jgi:hypothetical protein